MNKNILIKYVSGQASGTEEQAVLSWAAKAPANELYLARLQNLWISQNMPQEKASAAQVAKMMSIVRSREAVSGTSTGTGNETHQSGAGDTGVYRIKKGWFWSVAASIVLLLGVGVYQLSDRNVSVSGNELAQAVSAVTYKNFETHKVLYTPKGVKAKVLLPDSSIVWLNSDTRLEYPDKFDSLERRVAVSGEAYFNVVKNANRPMVVNTPKGFSIKVLGTEFNLKAYEEDVNSQATLYTGEINLLRQEGNKIITTKVSPFQTVVIKQAGTTKMVSKLMKPVPLDDAAWKEGRIVFDSTPVSEVIKTLERWHGVDFVIENNEVLNYKITAEFNSESIVQVMDLIQMTSLVKYRVSDKKVFLSKK